MDQPSRQLPDLVQRYVSLIQRTKVPTLKVLPKSSSTLMQTIGWVFRKTGISPTFMEDYYTTIGSTIYVPDRFYGIDPSRLLETIMHECLHAQDHEKWSVLFPFTYLAPQALALLSVLVVLAPWHLGFLLSLCCLLFAAPLPSPGRYHWEVRAYRTSILFGRLVRNYSEANMQGVRTWIIGQLATKFYYFAWPFPASIEETLRDESFLGEQPYLDMIAFLKSEKLLA